MPGSGGSGPTHANHAVVALQTGINPTGKPNPIPHRNSYPNFNTYSNSYTYAYPLAHSHPGPHTIGAATGSL